MMNNTTIDTRASYDRYIRRGEKSDALPYDMDPANGYLLREEMEEKLVNTLCANNVLRSLCTGIKTSYNAYLPIVSSHGKAEWVPDGAAVPLVRDTFDRAVLDSNTLAATIRVTKELLKDSAIDIEQYLADTFADRLADSEEAAFIAGDGMDKPKGLIHQVKIGCETTAAGTVSLDDVLNLIFSVPEKYRRRGVLLMNDATLLNLYLQCAEQSSNLWFGKNRDGQDTFFGVRIACCGSMSDVASGQVPVLFGDFCQVYINDCGKRSIKRLNELYAASDHVGFMLSQRSGIKLTVPEAVKGLKVA